MSPPTAQLLDHLRELAMRLRAAVRRGMRTESIDVLSRAVDERGGDTIFHLDEHGEKVLLDYCALWGAEQPFLLIAEGLVIGQRSFPPDGTPAFTLIVDPVDGTRGLMYDKRSAWSLLAIAPPPREGWHPTLADITVALQSELPTSRAVSADLLWAVRGLGAGAERIDLRTQAVTTFTPQPSQASTLLGGFAAIVKFLPGTKRSAAALEEALYARLYGPQMGQIFDDEYISSGGQLYELMVGHDRFIADLRPLLSGVLAPAQRLCAHPYDLCTALIATELGVIVTSPDGSPLASPLDTTTNTSWLGFANARLRDHILSDLEQLLPEYSM